MLKKDRGADAEQGKAHSELDACIRRAEAQIEVWPCAAKLYQKRACRKVCVASSCLS